VCCRQTSRSVRGQASSVFNIHLGTSHMERRSQAARLLSPDRAGQEALGDPRLIVGDFNEWTVGLTTRLLRGKLQELSAAAWVALSPHIYRVCCRFSRWDTITTRPPLKLEEARLWRSRKALVRIRSPAVDR